MENQDQQAYEEFLGGISTEQLSQKIEELQEVLKQKQLAAQAPKPAEAVAEFEHDGTRYGILVPQFRLDKVVYKAKEAAANPEVCAKLVALASEGPEGPRDEESFDENGLLRILY